MTAPQPVKTGFKGLPWLVRWAVYTVCLSIIVPVVVYVAFLLFVAGYIGVVQYENHTAQAKIVKPPRVKP